MDCRWQEDCRISLHEWQFAGDLEEGEISDGEEADALAHQVQIKAMKECVMVLVDMISRLQGKKGLGIIEDHQIVSQKISILSDDNVQENP